MPQTCFRPGTVAHRVGFEARKQDIELAYILCRSIGKAGGYPTFLIAGGVQVPSHGLTTHKPLLILLCHKLISLFATAARTRSHSSDEPERQAMA